MSMGALISYVGSSVAGGGVVAQPVSTLFPLPVALSGGIGGLAVAGVQPAGAAATENPVMAGGVDGGGFIRNLLTDVAGVLQVNATLAGGSITVAQGAGNTANPWTVQGPAASATANGGNPVKVGAVFSAAALTLAAGQVGDSQVNASGYARVTLAGISSTATDAKSNSGVALYQDNSFANSGLLFVASYAFNGATWDRLTKPRTAFRLPSSAATNNAANIKTTPGTVFQISANITLAASTCYLKFFDTTGVPNPAALTPLYMFALNIVNGQVSFNLPGQGIYFPTGIGVAIVANPADLDNTAIAAAQITALQVMFA